MKRTSVGLAFVIASFVSGRASADFINGSFEQATVNPGSGYATLAGGSTAITGWTVTGNSIDYIGGYWQPSNGTRSLDLSGNDAGGIAQTFTTTAGASYSVLFDLAGNPEGSPSVKTVEVSAAGQVQDYTFNTTGHTDSAMGWTTMTFQFTATGASTTLQFASLTAGAYGPALDNVSVTPSAAAVPEPSSLVLCGVAAAVGLSVSRVRPRRPVA